MQNTTEQVQLYAELITHCRSSEFPIYLANKCKNIHRGINAWPASFSIMYSLSVHYCLLRVHESWLFHKNLKSKNDFNQMQITSVGFRCALSRSQYSFPTMSSNKAKHVLFLIYDAAYLLEQSPRHDCLYLLEIGCDAGLYKDFNPFFISHMVILRTVSPVLLCCGKVAIE